MNDATNVGRGQVMLSRFIFQFSVQLSVNLHLWLDFIFSFLLLSFYFTDRVSLPSQTFPSARRSGSTLFLIWKTATWLMNILHISDCFNTFGNTKCNNYAFIHFHICIISNIFCGQTFTGFHQYSTKIKAWGLRILKAQGLENLKVNNSKYDVIKIRCKNIIIINIHFLFCSNLQIANCNLKIFFFLLLLGLLLLLH